MQYKSLLIIFVILFSYLNTSYVSATDLFTVPQTIYIQPVINPNKILYDNQTALRNQVGADIYDKCYQSCNNNATNDQTLDTQSKQYYISWCTTQCLTKISQTVSNNIHKKSNDQICEEKQGINTKWTGQHASNGDLLCGCKDGFVTNKNNRCITPNESCSIDYPSAVWNGKYNSDNGLQCDCPTNYTWNSSNTACVLKTYQAMGGGGSLIPNQSTPVTCSGAYGMRDNKCVRKDEICATDFGTNATWNGATDNKGNIVCECKIGYVWNSSKTSCNLTPKKQEKAVQPIQNVTAPLPDTATISNPVATPTTPLPVADLKPVEAENVSVMHKTISWFVGLFGYRLEK